MKEKLKHLMLEINLTFEGYFWKLQELLVFILTLVFSNEAHLDQMNCAWIKDIKK